MRMGYNYQLKVQWTGHAMLHHMTTWATPTPATRNTVCLDGPCNVLAGCLDNPFGYVIEPGAPGLQEWNVPTDSGVINVPTGTPVTPT
jgi:hypothetical protein